MTTKNHETKDLEDRVWAKSKFFRKRRILMISVAVCITPQQKHVKRIWQLIRNIGNYLGKYWNCFYLIQIFHIPSCSSVQIKAEIRRWTHMMILTCTGAVLSQYCDTGANKVVSWVNIPDIMSVMFYKVVTTVTLTTSLSTHNIIVNLVVLGPDPGLLDSTEIWQQRLGIYPFINFQLVTNFVHKDLCVKMIDCKF